MASEPVARPLERLGSVPIELTVELGHTAIPLDEMAEQVSIGSVITLGKLTGEILDVLVNGRVVARGEIVVIGGRYGLRITETV